MMRPPPSICSLRSRGPLVRITADAAYDTVAVYDTAGARGATVGHPTGQDGERLWARPAVARAGSNDHVGEAARPAPVEEGVPGTIVRAGWRTRSSDTSPSSEMAFAPGVQPGRGVRSFLAVRSSIG